jgi:hypothetical protein
LRFTAPSARNVADDVQVILPGDSSIRRHEQTITTSVGSSGTLSGFIEQQSVSGRIALQKFVQIVYISSAENVLLIDEKL